MLSPRDRRAPGNRFASRKNLFWTRLFPTSPAARKKGIPAGHYTTSKDNKAYAAVLGPLLPNLFGVIATNMGHKLFVALQLKVAHYFI
jgi:hypothetical protein